MEFTPPPEDDSVNHPPQPPPPENGPAAPPPPPQINPPELRGARPPQPAEAADTEAAAKPPSLLGRFGGLLRMAADTVADKVQEGVKNLSVPTDDLDKKKPSYGTETKFTNQLEALQRGSDQIDGRLAEHRYPNSRTGGYIEVLCKSDTRFPADPNEPATVSNRVELEVCQDGQVSRITPRDGAAAVDNPRFQDLAKSLDNIDYPTNSSRWFHRAVAAIRDASPEGHVEQLAADALVASAPTGYARNTVEHQVQREYANGATLDARWHRPGSHPPRMDRSPAREVHFTDEHGDTYIYRGAERDATLEVSRHDDVLTIPELHPDKPVQFESGGHPIDISPEQYLLEQDLHPQHSPHLAPTNARLRTLTEGIAAAETAGPRRPAPPPAP